MDKELIKEICIRYKIKNYSINSDGSIDVDDNVNLSFMELSKLPIKFNKVSGYFNCSYNKLTSLKGSPKRIGGGWFNCSYNNLTSFESLPKNHKYELFMCYGNPLKSFDGYNCSLKTFFCDDKEKVIRKTKINKIIKKI